MVGKKCKTGEVKCNKGTLKTFVGRKSGIMKKAYELSVLCGVSVGVVIFGPDKSTPHVWPQSSEDLHGIIGRYMNMNSDQSFKPDVAARNVESDEEIVGGNKGKEACSLVDHDDNDIEIEGLSVGQLVDLVGNLDAKIQMVNTKIDKMTRADQILTDQVGYMLPFHHQVQYPEHMPLPSNSNLFVSHEYDFHGYFGEIYDPIINIQDFIDFNAGTMSQSSRQKMLM